MMRFRTAWHFTAIPTVSNPILYFIRMTHCAAKSRLYFVLKESSNIHFKPRHIH